MAQTLEQQRQQVLQALEEESYLSREQRDQLRAIVQMTDKVTVMDTIENLLQRLLIQRTENYLLIIRKLQNALRLETRHMDEKDERRNQVLEDEASESLLKQIQS